MKIIFMGTPNFSVPILKGVIDAGYEVVGVVTQPDKPVGRSQRLKPSPIKELAISHEIEVFQPENIKTDYQDILDQKPDLIITAAYGQIIPDQMIKYPKYGCINVHASLLPKLRGGAPIHKAIINGDEKTGITIMDMVRKMDAGDIIKQEEVVIENDDTAGTLHARLSFVGRDLLLETIPVLESARETRTRQDESLVTYAYNIKREEERIDWNKSAREIYNQVRGLNPWPVSYTTLDDKIIKIWWIEETDEDCIEIPGTIINVSDDAINVCCGDKKVIRVKEIQPSGKKHMTVKDFMNGKGRQEVEVGKVFK